MTDTTGQGKTISHRRRNFLIACAVAVCVIAIYVLWRANVLPNPFGALTSSPLTTTHAQANALPNAAVFSTVGASGTGQILAAQNSRPATPDWKLFLDKLTRLLKDPKVEVCGLSDFEAAKYIAGDTEGDTNAMTSTLLAAMDKLKQSENPREKALGLYVQAHLADWVASIAEQGKFRICEGDFDCAIKLIDTNKAPKIKPEVSSTGVAPLVKLALSERDPAIIAAALYACARDQTGVCATISYADWVAVEPDNAAAWLKLADASFFSKDSAARDNALQRAATASGYDLRVPSLASVWSAELMQAQSPSAQFSIGLQLAVSQIMTSLPPTYAVVTQCRLSGLDDAHRVMCDAIASKLLEKDDSVIGLSTAAFIGEKIGWDKARVQALRDEKVVALELMIDAIPGANMYSCKNLAIQIQEHQAALTKSERAITRDRIAASGMSFAELVEKYRERSPGSFK